MFNLFARKVSCVYCKQKFSLKLPHTKITNGKNVKDYAHALCHFNVLYQAGMTIGLLMEQRELNYLEEQAYKQLVFAMGLGHMYRGPEQRTVERDVSYA